MNFLKVIVAICSLFFFMIGADKFLKFLEPACSLQSGISPTIWMILGVLQLISGVLIWMPKYQKHLAGFWAIFMLVFTAVHLAQGTTDIGGSLFMAALLGIIIWNPSFLRGKE